MEKTDEGEQIHGFIFSHAKDASCINFVAHTLDLFISITAHIYLGSYVCVLSLKLFGEFASVNEIFLELHCTERARQNYWKRRLGIDHISGDIHGSIDPNVMTMTMSLRFLCHLLKLVVLYDCILLH